MLRFTHNSVRTALPYWVCCGLSPADVLLIYSCPINSSPSAFQHNSQVPLVGLVGQHQDWVPQMDTDLPGPKKSRTKSRFPLFLGFAATVGSWHPLMEKISHWTTIPSVRQSWLLRFLFLIEYHGNNSWAGMIHPVPSRTPRMCWTNVKAAMGKQRPPSDRLQALDTSTPRDCCFTYGNARQ